MEDCYDLDGEKVLLCINVKKYKPHPDGRSRNRNGSEIDEEAIIKTFKEGIYRQYFCKKSISLKIDCYTIEFKLTLSYLGHSYFLGP